MTIEQLSKLLESIMKNNSWKQCSSLFTGKRQPKYIDTTVEFTMDTRDGIIFNISFRESRKDIKTFRVESEKDLKEVYEYLDEVIYTNHMDDHIDFPEFLDDENKTYQLRWDFN